MVRQTKLSFPPAWGGKRRGAGRKPKGKRAGASHLRRPLVSGWAPIIVTLPLVPAVGKLRTKTKLRALREAFAAGRERGGFRLVHYSVQQGHLHLMVEASDPQALSRGTPPKAAPAGARAWSTPTRVAATSPAGAGGCAPSGAGIPVLR